EESDREGGEGSEQRGGRIVGREEQPPDGPHEVAIDGEVVPLHQIADYAGDDDAPPGAVDAVCGHDARILDAVPQAAGTFRAARNPTRSEDRFRGRSFLALSTGSSCRGERLGHGGIVMLQTRKTPRRPATFLGGRAAARPYAALRPTPGSARSIDYAGQGV